jgi:3-oxoacyl-[acyl-carrier protein] reductase
MLIRFDGCTPAKGVGQAIARSLAGAGDCVFDLDEVVPIAARLNGAGKIIAAKVDVTDETSIAEVVRGAGDTTDILVYVAGGARGQARRPLEEVTADDFEAIVDVNLRGTSLFANAAAPGMKGKATSRIITISSRAGLEMSLTGIQSYAVAKHGQIGHVKPIALKPFDITVHSIAPGFMATGPDCEQQSNNWSPEFRENFVNNIAMRRMGVPKTSSMQCRSWPLTTPRGLPGRPSPSLATRRDDAIVFRRTPNMRGNS